MKRIIFFLLLISLILPSISAATDFKGFLVLDQITNTVEVYDGQDRIKSFKSEPKPARVINNHDNGGYILLQRGAKKKSGSLTFLDLTFTTFARKELPGIVVQDFYLKKTGLWLLFTLSSDKENPVATLTCFDLKTKETNTIPLMGPPVVYRFNEDRTELAVGTLGSFETKAPAQLVLIDLTQKQVRNFPVSANPGAIYRTASGKFMVACGGYRNSQRYPSKTLIEKTATAELAQLHWIDPATGESQVTQLTYSPLLFGQDPCDSDTFYAVTTNVYGDPNEEQRGIVLGSTEDSTSQKPAATFYKITGGKVAADLELKYQPNQLTTTSTGRVCLQSDKELLIIDVSGPTPKLLEYDHDKSIDEFLINPEGTIGYLSNVNSNLLDVIDLINGKAIKTIKISKSFFIGKLSFNLFGSGFPPVIRHSPTGPVETVNSSINRRMFFAKDFSRLYILAGGAEVSIVNLQTNEVEGVIKFNDTQYGIHPTPNHQYLVVAAEGGWHLLDPVAGKEIFSLNFNLEENEQGPEQGFYKPGGDLLIVPFKNYLYFIDPIQGGSLGKIRTKALAPLIVWPE